MVIAALGSSPSLKPNCSMSHFLSGYFQAAISSHQLVSCWGPLNLSGSSALKSKAIAPLGQVACVWMARRQVGSTEDRPQYAGFAFHHCVPGIGCSGCYQGYPVSYTRFYSFPDPFGSCLSLPVPSSRSKSQYCQSPPGSSCLGRAQNFKSYSNF